MKLGEANRDRLRRIYLSRSLQGPHLTTQQEAVLINSIGDSLEPASVPPLSGLLADTRERVSSSAATSLQQILERCSPTELVQLDEMVRQLSEWRWPQISPKFVRALALNLWGVLGVLSFNSSGYVREAAILELTTRRDGQELPFLLIRLNDWVKQVRDAARKAVNSRIEVGYASHFVRCLPLVYRLKAQSRADHAAVITAIFGLLRQAESRSCLYAALLSTDTQVRRLAYRLIVETATPDLHQVLASVLASSDPVLRWSAARELRKRLDGQPLRELLGRLNADRLMPVRREALYGFVEKLPDVAHTVLHAALLDPHPSMREVARFYLKRAGFSDFAAFYRSKLDASKSGELAAAVAGLGETGAATDGMVLATYLNDPSIRIRRAAVRAVGHLVADAFLDAMLAALQDPNGSVVKAARAALESRPHQIPPDQLWSIFQKVVNVNTRRRVLSLMAKLSWWDSVQLLMMAAGEDNPEIRELAIHYLHMWQFNTRRLYSRPRLDQFAAIEQSLELHGDRLDQSIRTDLESILAYTKRELL